jgi:hypothetical protein
VIDPDFIRRGCRRGYARHICTDAAQIEPDASQCLIKAHYDHVIQVAWSLERNHHPVAVGLIEIAAGVTPQTALEHQAHALASQYLTNTGQQQ